MATLLGVIAVLAAYLIGSIPFGLMIARAVAGIDIRAIGSGNTGATNVGRILGMRWFAVVFALDFAKGCLPTLGVPRLLHALGYPSPPWLPVLVGLAAILGHNFPVYLRFKGGKGVATSLGTVMALEPVSAIASAFGFLIFFLVTRFVSLSSILAGVVFAAVYFQWTDTPWDSTHMAMSVATITLLVMLIARHRTNLVRIAAGTEPKVNFRKKRMPRGQVRVLVLIGVFITTTVGVALFWISTRQVEVVIGGYRFQEVARAATGHQRADRIIFAQGGKTLAVNCPRYNRVVIYEVAPSGKLTMRHDFAVDGRPVSILATQQHLLVLQRPTLDQRHLGPGWFDTFDFEGKPVGTRRSVGYDPDDFAILPDQRHLVLLQSGRAEGEANRPAPDLAMLDLDDPKAIEDCPHVVFAEPGDDPERIRLSADGRSAVVTFRYLNQVAKLDMTNLAKPQVIERITFDDMSPLAENPERETLTLAPGIVLQTLPDHSALRVFGEADGVIPLFGPLRLANVRPNGMAVSAERGLIAVASKAGSVHLIAAVPLLPSVALAEESSLR